MYFKPAGSYKGLYYNSKMTGEAKSNLVVSVDNHTVPALKRNLNMRSVEHPRIS